MTPIELERLVAAAEQGYQVGLRINAGHGLNRENLPLLHVVPHLEELNIGHFLIGEAVFVGLDAAIRRMRGLMDEARA